MISRLVRQEQGWTVVELVVVIGLSMVLLTAASVTLMNAQRSTRFAEQEASALDRGRLALERVERDVRSAQSFRLCAAPSKSDNCLELLTVLGNGVQERIRYATEAGGVSGSLKLVRQSGCTAGASGLVCTSSQVLLDNVKLGASERLFTCREPGGQNIRLDVLLRLSPLATASEEGTIVLSTSANPRIISTVTCPTTL